MREVELKSVVEDMEQCIARVRAAGGELVIQGRLRDRRYDTHDRVLGARDEMLRVRAFEGLPASSVTLDWKGPTRLENGYKVREEISTGLADADATFVILAMLGYVCTMAIDRDVAQFTLSGATVRFERYPRMDDLVEVEGTPEAIESAIAMTGLSRHGFTSDRLGDFANRFESRTGVPAALSDSPHDST